MSISMIIETAKIITSSINRKRTTQALFVDSNAFGYRLKNSSQCTDKEYFSNDYIGTFKPKVSRTAIEKELNYQQQIINIT